MFPRTLLITAISVAALGLSMLLPAQSAQAATCWFGSCFSYVSGRQTVSTTGASVAMMQATPRVAHSNGHSLQELALQTSDRSAIVEVGWTVDRGLNGDDQPHLFVYHWVNNQTSCYNGCGFVPYAGGVRAGQAVQSGTSATFGIYNYSGNWWIYYDNQPVGYFPGSLWGGAFTHAQVVTAFGEVADPNASSCTDMGNAQYGTSPGSSWIADYQLSGASQSPSFQVSATDAGYVAGSVTATSFHLGGPGAC